MHLNNLFNETIRKEGDKYVVRSKKGKSMGKYNSKSAAEKRLRQVEMFKHMAESIKLKEAERDIQVEVPGIGVYTADTLSSNIIQSIDKLHRAAEAGDWEQVEYSLDPSKMGGTLLIKSQALVQALKQNRMLEATATDSISKQAGAEDKWVQKQVDAVDNLVQKHPGLANTVKAKKVIPGSSLPAEVPSSTLKNFAKQHAGKIIPGAGAGLTAYDAGSEVAKGNYGRAAQKLAAAAGYMVPGVGIPLGLLIDPDSREAAIDILNKAAKPEDNEELLRGTGPMGLMPETIEFAKHLSNIETEILGEAGKDACYHKVKSRYKVWPSAYASGALVQCRKKGAKNWGNKSKK